MNVLHAQCYVIVVVLMAASGQHLKSGLEMPLNVTS